MQHQIGVVLRRGVPPYLEVAEQAFEKRSLPHVIVLAQHAHQKRLAETAGAYEEEIAVSGLYLGDEAGPVDVIVIGEAQILPILHAVWDAFELLLFHARCFRVCLSKCNE